MTGGVRRGVLSLLRREPRSTGAPGTTTPRDASRTDTCRVAYRSSLETAFDLGPDLPALAGTSTTGAVGRHSGNVAVRERSAADVDVFVEDAPAPRSNPALVERQHSESEALYHRRIELSGSLGRAVPPPGEGENEPDYRLRLELSALLVDVVVPPSSLERENRHLSLYQERLKWAARAKLNLPPMRAPECAEDFRERLRASWACSKVISPRTEAENTQEFSERCNREIQTAEAPKTPR